MTRVLAGDFVYIPDRERLHELGWEEIDSGAAEAGMICHVTTRMGSRVDLDWMGTFRQVGTACRVRGTIGFSYWTVQPADLQIPQREPIRIPCRPMVHINGESFSLEQYIEAHQSSPADTYPAPSIEMAAELIRRRGLTPPAIADRSDGSPVILTFDGITGSAPSALDNDDPCPVWRGIEYPVGGTNYLLDVGTVLRVPEHDDLIERGWEQNCDDGRYNTADDRSVLCNEWAGRDIRITRSTEDERDGGRFGYLCFADADIYLTQTSWWIRSDDLAGFRVMGRRTIIIGQADQPDNPGEVEKIETLPTEEKPSMRAKFMPLASTVSAIDAANKGLIRCGFELEFQSLNGRISEADDETEYDENAIEDAVQSAYDDADFDDLQEYMDSDLSDMFSQVNTLTGESHDEIAERFRSNRTVHTRLTRAIREMRSEFMQDYRDNMDMSDYRNESNGNCYETLETSYRRILDCGYDGSVSGGEIRTRGGLTPTTFILAATDLLENNDWNIDTGCSFHIHLSVAGVKHSYGSGMQAELSAYLLSQYHRWPASLKKRFGSDARNRYFAAQVSNEKYSMVYCNIDIGTWEFRLFGNVTTGKEARTSLYLAIDAMRHAYAVRCGLAKSLVPKSGGFITAVGNVIEVVSGGFPEAAKQVRKELRLATQAKQSVFRVREFTYNVMPLAGRATAA